MPHPTRVTRIGDQREAPGQVTAAGAEQPDGVPGQHLQRSAGG